MNKGMEVRIQKSGVRSFRMNNEEYRYSEFSLLTPEFSTKGCPICV